MTRQPKHDDMHFPLQGRGAKGRRIRRQFPISPGAWRKCKACEEFGPIFNDHYCGDKWVSFDYKNSIEASLEDVKSAWNNHA